MTNNEELRAELLRLKAEDGALWRELVEAGQLYGPHLPKDWYNPRMAPLHRGNTARLGEIVAETAGRASRRWAQRGPRRRGSSRSTRCWPWIFSDRSWLP